MGKLTAFERAWQFMSKNTPKWASEVNFVDRAAKDAELLSNSFTKVGEKEAAELEKLGKGNIGEFVEKTGKEKRAFTRAKSKYGFENPTSRRGLNGRYKRSIEIPKYGENNSYADYIAKQREAMAAAEEASAAERAVGPNTRFGVQPRRGSFSTKGIRYANGEAAKAEEALERSDRASGLAEKRARLLEQKRAGLTGRAKSFLDRHKFATGLVAGFGGGALASGLLHGDGQKLPPGFQVDPETGAIIGPDGQIYDPQTGEIIGGADTGDVNYLPGMGEDDEEYPEEGSPEFNGFHSREEEMAAVAQVQQHLNDRGFSLRVDGMWGPKTQAAYEAAQRGVNPKKKKSSRPSGDLSYHSPSVDNYKVVPMVQI